MVLGSDASGKNNGLFVAACFVKDRVYETHDFVPLFLFDRQKTRRRPTGSCLRGADCFLTITV